MTDPIDETEAEADAATDRDEPRGPHLPDRMASIPLLSWLFVALAVADLYWLLRTDTAGASLLDLFLYGLNVIPSVVAILIPAALLWRHPDAISRARTLLFGAILFAAVEGLQVLSAPLQPYFEQLTPASEEVAALIPLSAAYGGLVSLVGSFGLLYIAVGLSRARQYEDRSRIGPKLIVPIAALLATASGLLTISGIPSTVVITSTVVIFLGAQLILGVLTVVAWSYLTMTTLRGQLAGETPRSGWALASLGGGLILAAIALNSVGNALKLQEATGTLILNYLTLAAYSFGHLCVLLAFVMGLPSLEDDEADDEAPEPDDEADATPEPDDATPEAPGL